jgi:hypothetical protein
MAGNGFSLSSEAASSPLNSNGVVVEVYRDSTWFATFCAQATSDLKTVTFRQIVACRLCDIGSQRPVLVCVVKHINSKQ